MRADRFRSLRRSSGVTLIELMVAVSLLVVLLAVGLPSFTNVIQGNRLTSFANSFVSATQLARSEAIKRNARIKLCVANSDGTACTTGGWHQGWILFQDLDDDRNVDTDEVVLLRQTALDGGVSLTDTDVSPVTQVMFLPAGEVDVSRAFLLCPAQPSSEGKRRVMRLSLTGRVAITTEKTETTLFCP